jgi:hypothetical protein
MLRHVHAGRREGRDGASQYGDPLRRPRRGRSLSLIVALGVILLSLASVQAGSIQGNKWGYPALGTLGGASFSLMGPGVPTEDGGVTVDLGLLTNNPAGIIEQALEAWSYAAKGRFDQLGQRSDNGAPFDSPPADPQGGGEPFGDIRVGATPLTSGVLAHAYYPPPLAGFQSAPGDVHFNSDLPWVDDPHDSAMDPGYDFYTVALHELGHSLGLKHSADPNSVMYPWYSGGRRDLTEDDIRTIRKVYGIGSPCVPPPTEYAAAQHRYPGFNIYDLKHSGFPRCDPLPTEGNPLFHSFASIFESTMIVGGMAQRVVALGETGVQVEWEATIGNRTTYNTRMTDLWLHAPPANSQLFEEGVNLPQNIIISLDPDRETIGKVIVDQANCEFTLYSYFDVYTRLSLDGGATWIPSLESSRMETHWSAACPEPSTWVMTVSGGLLCGLWCRARRRTA